MRHWAKRWGPASPIKTWPSGRDFFTATGILLCHSSPDLQDDAFIFDVTIINTSDNQKKKKKIGAR